MKDYVNFSKNFFYFFIILLFYHYNIAYGEDVKDKNHIKNIYIQGITVIENKQVTSEQKLDIVDIDTNKKGVISSIPDTLEQVSGIDVQRIGILTPKNTQVRLRGFDERRYLVLLNGRRLNGTGVMGGYFIDWSMISLENWRYMEISKGAFSAKYGNTLGGYINLVSPLPNKSEFSFNTGYKRYDTYSITAMGQGRHSNLGIKISTGYYSTNGYLRNSGANRANFGGDVYYFFNDNEYLRLGLKYNKGDFQMPVENKKDKIGYDSHYPESTGTYLVGPGIKFQPGDTNGDNSFYRKKKNRA